MVKIALPKPEIQSTSRIPRANVSGGIALGQAAQNLGRAGAGLAAGLQRMEHRQEAVDQRKAAFDADYVLQQQRMKSGDVLQVSEQGAGVDGSGQQKIGLDYMAKNGGIEIKNHTAKLRKAGHHAVADQLEKQWAGEIEKRRTQLRAQEAQGRRKFEADTVNDQTQGMLPSVTADREANEKMAKSIHDTIDKSTTLNDFEKQEAKQAVTRAMKVREAEVKAGGDPREMTEMVGGRRTSMDQGMMLLRHHEGFRPGTYHDVNHQRTGYGSDTITDRNGRVYVVRKGMRVTREDAERDLRRRTAISANRAMGAMGAGAWAGLSPQAQAVAIAITYNYGEFPKRLIRAFQSGDPGQMAAAVQGLGSDNKGVNRNRRNQEAEYLLTGKISGVDTSKVSATTAGNGQYNELTMTDRRKLLSGALTTKKAQDDLVVKAQSTEYDAYKDAIGLQIAQGGITDQQTIFSDPKLKDKDKDSLSARLKDVAKARILEADAAQAIRGEAPVAQATKGERDAAEKVYKGLFPVDKMGDGRAATAMARGRYVPKYFMDGLNTALHEGQSANLTRLLGEMSRLSQLRPDLVDAGDAKKMADLARTWEGLARARQSTTAATDEILQWQGPEGQKGLEELKKSTVYTEFTKKYTGITGMQTAGVLPTTYSETAFWQGQRHAIVWDALVEAKIAEMPWAIVNGQDSELIDAVKVDFEKHFGPTAVTPDDTIMSHTMYPMEKVTMANGQTLPEIYSGTVSRNPITGRSTTVPDYTYLNREIEAELAARYPGKKIASWSYFQTPGTGASIRNKEPLIAYKLEVQFADGSNASPVKPFLLDISAERMSERIIAGRAMRREMDMKILKAEIAERGEGLPAITPEHEIPPGRIPAVTDPGPAPAPDPRVERRERDTRSEQRIMSERFSAGRRPTGERGSDLVGRRLEAAKKRLREEQRRQGVVPEGTE